MKMTKVLGAIVLGLALIGSIAVSADSVSAKGKPAIEKSSSSSKAGYKTRPGYVHAKTVIERKRQLRQGYLRPGYRVTPAERREVLRQSALKRK